MSKEKFTPITYVFTGIILVVFLLSLLYSARRNFREGVFVDDRFFYLTEGTLLEYDEQNQIRLKGTNSGTDFTITSDGAVQSASLKSDGDHVTITYDNGTVFEGDWNGKSVSEDSDEEHSLNQALCQISRNKLVKRHSLLTILLGIAFYLIGALEFLNPDTYRIFLRGWKYDRNGISKESAASEKIGGIVVMLIGLIALTGIFIS